MKPDDFTFATALSAASILHGKQIHALVIRTRLNQDVGVDNALTKMYANAVPLHIYIMYLTGCPLTILCRGMPSLLHLNLYEPDCETFVGASDGMQSWWMKAFLFSIAYKKPTALLHKQHTSKKLIDMLGDMRRSIRIWGRCMEM
ncbi:hypothetical protein V6N13_129369 [Hibiscus sabdariffa]|uniref:Uncharacterized protein n=1 Tax=Hibiscus sabdariffa TaxID=183260 RepID=A0ABR2SKZ7_9ROSI